MNNNDRCECGHLGWNHSPSGRTCRKNGIDAADGSAICPCTGFKKAQS